MVLQKLLKLAEFRGAAALAKRRLIHQQKAALFYLHPEYHPFGWYAPEKHFS